ncbi:hypothetical protein [Microbacterium sulfonylureivorans]|uniref:hypothetical protein n=1 Tax=Microbacterium sulfonylureivorans TaxID=2486854 RepID=UPI000FDC5782|nr:hypothetical protein [Microbacterium sulfonylureivorans]
MRLRYFAAGGLVMLAIAAGSPAANAADVCTNRWQCKIENSGSQVDISADLNRPGSPGRGGDAGADAIAPPVHSATPDAVPAEPEDCGPLGCRGDYEVAALPDVTLADIASFRPAAPSLTGEPAGFGVVGMPTNLVGEASEQRMTGTVLGWDVTVRFVPAEFVFAHGDGTSATAGTGGASWSSLGQAQFTPTATSHVYDERGTFPVGVTVRYAASVDFGNGSWRPVPGYVTASSGGYEVRVVEVRTALVDETCREDPTGPGC